MLIGIVGCGGFGREIMPIVRETVERAGTNVRLVFVETDRPSRSAVNGYPVLSEKEFLAADDQEKHFNIAIADSRVRERIAARFIEAGARAIAVRSLQATIYEANKIGEGSIICAGSIVTSNATIGRFFHCNIQSYVAHDCFVGDFVTFAPRVACNGNVVVEDHAYVGTGALIREGKKDRPLRIGKGAIVGMGAVVTKDIPAGETWVGSPARPMVQKFVDPNQ